ncbi:methionine adenosyltransferase [Candidatus Woesearchaeota archaeon CG11_big_fil_rev_8_21_14_0_20_43_8]|nr:MAG: methionine adenosyltransferase [Candidatus Woesearchaeota archaeon CG11_big_fil_rev_8_21_14_0_20_43_8]PIO05215.1 MAG: methionine adenosyltransferase [Candidatus Woesearchaeota archaeon CG08_land_8_20_14_0_20_43_7]
MLKGKYLFTSESVAPGHPDKVCDHISDGVLDEALRQDPASRVAIECLIKTGFVVVAGEMTTSGYIDVQKIARDTIKKIGYDDPLCGFDGNTCGVLVSISEQSPDISQGVTEGMGLHKEQGAGDQGIMFGYATNETKELMPLPLILSHKILRKLDEMRRDKKLPYLWPDAKSQVTVEYENGKPLRVDTVVVSASHKEEATLEQIRKDIVEKVVKPVCDKWLDKDTKYHINPTGRFVQCGPVADAGVTGRKIIVDTYGGHGSHGGGAFSGKDPTKVDRSAAYACRYIAKNVVAAGLADKCEVQLGYAIGVAEPVSILVHCFETNKIPEERIAELVKKHFPTTPSAILKELKLRRPIYQKTAAYGHFGRDDPDFTWEYTDKVDVLKKEAGSHVKPKKTGDDVPFDGE